MVNLGLLRELDNSVDKVHMEGSEASTVTGILERGSCPALSALYPPQTSALKPESCFCAMLLFHLKTHPLEDHLVSLLPG